MTEQIKLEVNGVAAAAEIGGDPSLLTVLREQLGLTGAKIGCAEGQCGACTVLVDDHPVRACVTPARAAVGRQVRTIEGLEQAGQLHPLQQAFLDQAAFQCGYCTPGMIMSGVALLQGAAEPSVDEIVAALQGNICRCGTYPRIIAAIQQAAAELREARGAEHAG